MTLFLIPKILLGGTLLLFTPFHLFLFPFICLFHPCLPVEVYLLTIKTYHCSIYQRTNSCHSHQLSTILCTQTVSVPLCLSSSSCQITMLLMLVVTNAIVLFQIVRYKFPLVRFSIECRETKAITLNSSITQSYSNQINMAGAKCGKKCTKDSRLVNWISKLCELFKPITCKQCSFQRPSEKSYNVRSQHGHMGY